MRQVFADTFYYLALLNPHDDAHGRAVEFTAGLAGKMVTIDRIVMELADALSPAHTRSAAIRFIQSLFADRAVQIEPASRGLLDRGWQLYRRRPDKGVVAHRLHLVRSDAGPEVDGSIDR
jgi:predicted nucleic acid-binding protein